MAFGEPISTPQHDDFPRRVCILGSTGSIGQSALEVIRRYPGMFEVAGLAARGNVDAFAAQVRDFRPKYVAMSDLDAAAALRDLNLGVEVLAGPEGIETLAAQPCDIVLCAIVGAAGLKPVLAAIHAGRRIALANKEPLVMAGGLIMDAARRCGVDVIPVDSEHNAIFQCLQGHNADDVRCIHLTASGGPFYRATHETLAAVTPDQATRHPTWKMGAKISVDSSTLMNKGLEIIEAMWLFGLPLEKVEVIIHPQSIVHSLVEFNDGSILGQMGVTDMKFPIQFALTWPRRVEKPMARLDLTRLRELTFAAPDLEAFPCLSYAQEAARRSGTVPASLNAANEVAVEAFCAREIGFLDIARVVRSVLDSCEDAPADNLAAVLEADAVARERAWSCIRTIGNKNV